MIWLPSWPQAALLKIVLLNELLSLLDELLSHLNRLWRFVPAVHGSPDCYFGRLPDQLAGCSRPKSAFFQITLEPR
jgi:hypothetical protein